MNNNVSLDDNFTFEYNDIDFDSITLENHITIEGKRFEKCAFKKCQFSEIEFKKCNFIDCEFVNCNLSIAKFTASSFNEVVFENTRLTGIDWTHLQWPLIKLTCPIKFYQCDISFGNFFEVNLIETVLEQCKVHETDFRGADLRSASLCYNDFELSLFQHCNLTKADFTGSTNYLINPDENNLSKAKFSFPEVIGLIKHLDITISDFE